MIKIGDKVKYYDYTSYEMRTGIVTDIDVVVEWVWHRNDNGVIMASRYRSENAYHPLGVKINNSLTRPYVDDSKTRISS